MNVLIYSGPGASQESTKQALLTLRKLLAPNYAVSLVTEHQILKEPWSETAAAIVFPGGADLPYGRLLNGKGNAAIQKYIKKGGRYLGICAGAYYGSSFCKFEQGTPNEVTGPRELALFKGDAIGACFKRYVYGSNEGAHAAKIKADDGSEFYSFINGGCYFSGKDANAEVLATFTEDVDAPQEVAPANPPATIIMNYGQGKVLLSGTHLEYSTSRMKNSLDPAIGQAVEKDEQPRIAFFRRALEKLGLRTSDPSQPVIPKITPLYLSGIETNTSPSVRSFMQAMVGIVSEHQIKDANDTFELVEDPAEIPKDDESEIKYIIVRDEDWPSARETPYFNHSIYYSTLRAEHDELIVRPSGLGRLLMYSEVVTSTSTMLDRNPKFLRAVPHGTIIVGTQQVQGRGRGSNVWVNPVGVLAVSGVIRIPVDAIQHSLVFFQYLVSLAVVESVKSFGPAHKEIDIRLKWPNDVYIKHKGNYVKIGGVLTTANLFDREYVVTFGAGTNVENEAPTTSINAVIDEIAAEKGVRIAHISQEQLLGKFMARLDQMSVIFLAQGFAPFESRYYDAWLHSDTMVRLDQYQNVRAQIRGITPDSGMLLVQEVDSLGRPTGAIYELQPDGNSFDMLKGLIRKKE